MSTVKFNKTQLIEVIIPASTTATRFNIPDQPQLRDKRTLSIEVFNADDVTVSPSNNAVVIGGNLERSFLTLYINEATGESGEYIQNIPMTVLRRVAGSSNAFGFVYDLPEFNGNIIDWSKSYITCQGGTWSSQLSYLINVNYQR
jgi:hypothetical protein